MRFASDNSSGAAPEIMAAVAKANEGYERILRRGSGDGPV
jgi:threonine aldolase